MSVIKFLRDITGLFNWSTDANPTSQQDYQNAVKNWQETEKNLVDSILWQPETEYAVGNVLKTPSLPPECALLCVAAGISGATEPVYTSVSVGDTVTDGTVEWLVTQSSVDSQLFDNLLTVLQDTSKNLPAGTAFPALSVLSKMISNMNSEDGVQYNFTNANAWYICLGAKYGGLIIQGGKETLSNGATYKDVYFPVSLKDLPYSISATAFSGWVKYSNGGNSTWIRFTSSVANDTISWMIVGVAA